MGTDVGQGFFYVDRVLPEAFFLDQITVGGNHIRTEKTVVIGDHSVVDPMVPFVL